MASVLVRISRKECVPRKEDESSEAQRREGGDVAVRKPMRAPRQGEVEATPYENVKSKLKKKRDPTWMPN